MPFYFYILWRSFVTFIENNLLAKKHRERCSGAQDVLGFFVLFQNRRFCAEFGQKMYLQKRSCPLSFLIFFVVFDGFGQAENKKEKKNDNAAGKIKRCPLSFLLLDPLGLPNMILPHKIHCVTN